MKRLLTVLLALICVLLVIASCGDSGGVDTGNGGTTDSTPQGSGGKHTHEYPDEWKRISFATCKKKGVSLKECLDETCKHKIYEYDEMLPHTEEILPAIQGSCERDGYSEGVWCSVCKTVLTERVMTPKESFHKYTVCDSVVKQPSLTQSGEARFKCELCNQTNNVTIDKYVTKKLVKKDIYDITTNDIYNPAVDNKWKVIDGNKNTTGIYNTGDDWFGNVGDILTITLDEEMILTDLKLYLSGNWTFADVRVKNAKGSTVKSYGGVKANGAAYGGEAHEFVVFSGISVDAYTIEIEIKDNKGSYMNFKVAEIEMIAAKKDTRLPHTHIYRDFVETTQEATCRKTGLASYACYCGVTTEKETPRAPHDYSILDTYVAPTCTENGKSIYKCECGIPKEKTLYAQGHIFAKLQSYVTEPTAAGKGEGIFKCIGCSLAQRKEIAPLALTEIKYLRVDSIENGEVVLKFNVYDTMPSIEIRYSKSPITAENILLSTKVDSFRLDGEKEISATFSLNASLNECYYVAVRAYNGDNYGDIVSVRVGGNLLIPIDYSNATVYHGEVLNSFAPMFDEQSDEYRTGSKTPSTVLGQIFKDENDKVLYGSNLSPIIDLEYKHFISSVYLYFNGAYSIRVRYSDTAVDFMADDSEWDGVFDITSKSGWNEIAINKSTRYIQVIFKDGQAPYEILVYGYQEGEGDEISTEVKEIPTLGELMGMCGFVASGSGNTPIDSVSCTTVLRDYHSFEWTYTTSSYPYGASFFTGWMGDFDESYRKYSDAGILVVPCFQWKMGETSLALKVDSNNMPKKVNNEYVAASFWERFNPHTYFVYADAMFVFSARYGSTGSSELLQIVDQHINTDRSAVGLGYIKWVELGNEPDGSWNGIHNYYSAYQLAALTSAAYDGHCKTMASPVSAKGYHLGVINADPTMKVALAGISGTSNEYITALMYWMKANRNDGKTAFDAFNVHHYMSKEITLPNGNKAYVGMSPDEADIGGVLSKLVGIRDKYYSDKEVWLSEFGWDTNQSYATVNSAHAYGDYTGRQVQAMWLTRAYLILSASGINKATMYMCEDVGTVESEAVGKFATSGVIGFEYDEYGDVVEVKKDSYYYLYTLKNTLGEYAFEQKIEAYDEDVTIYKYKTADGKTAYAIWCNTSDGTRVEGYQLKIEGNSATSVFAEYGNVNGVKSTLTADDLGYIGVNVTENPTYILVD